MTRQSQVDRIRRFGLWDLASLVGLLVVALPASRLIVLMAGVCALALLAYIDDYRLQPRTAMISLAITLILLGALNFSRNGGFYRENGVANPVSMQMMAMATYLGSAAEGGVRAGDVLLGRTSVQVGGDSLRAVAPALPTFVVEPQEPIADIHDISTIDDSLTTNSMFAELVLNDGYYSPLVGLAIIGVVAFVCGRLLRSGDPAMVLAAGPLLYSFAEVWRLNLFNGGIVIFPVIATIGVGLLTRQRASVRALASEAPTERSGQAAPATGQSDMDTSVDRDQQGMERP